MAIPEHGPVRASVLPRLAVAAWAVAGVCWTVALFLPWSSHGPLSASSLMDGARLIRRGAVDAVLPASLAFVLLLPAAGGIGLVALAAVPGRVAATARVVLATGGAAATVVIAERVTGGAWSRAGVGGWVGLGGVVAAALAATVAAVDVLRRGAAKRRG